VDLERVCGNQYCYAETSCAGAETDPQAISGGAALPPPPPPPFFPFRNSSLPWADRLADLMSRLSLDDKVQFLQNHPSGIPALGIRPYSFETE
jgi:hypothetical protein